ncbi:MAG: tRNA-(ms[2]io[6]A)-hydroxylase [Myxococcota bacterium]|nr:tRNA-(ms[2]io[6]A)-hydroxylase [Myxococcota bacterium]
MFDLQFSTPPSWAEFVTKNLDDFLLDHAACERKASATAMSFVVKYRDRPQLVSKMITVAQEELEHFAQVTEIIHQRGLQLSKDTKDPYVNALLQRARHSPRERLIDRLLIFGIIEGRGCERFQLLADSLDDPSLRDFYHNLVRAEAKHHAAFLHLVRKEAPEKEWRSRLRELLAEEGSIVSSLPIRAALH